MTDGDEDLERYAKDFFPGVEHTLDIYHVLQYVWEAGRLFQTEGSEELAKWVKIQERLLYRGEAKAVANNAAAIRRLVSPAQRKRVDQIREYLAKRTSCARATLRDDRQPDELTGEGGVGEVR